MGVNEAGNVNPDPPQVIVPPTLIELEMVHVVEAVVDVAASVK